MSKKKRKYNKSISEKREKEGFKKIFKGFLRH